MHSSNRQLDLTTLFTRASMENNLHRLYGLTASEAKDKILNEECHELAIKIMSTLLFSTIIARMTSRPWGPERWCERYSKKNNLGEPSVRQPFLPDCTPLESDNFLQYLMRTCTDKRGNTGRMTQWTGQGDASSIPPDLKYADMFCSFVKGIQTTMRSASELLVRLARDVHSGFVDQMGSRDLAVETLKVFIESHLMADKVKGSKFKSHQVRHVVSLSSVSLPLTITDFLSLCSFFLCKQIAFDVEGLLPRIFGNCYEIVTGYGSDQGFKAVKTSELDDLPKEAKEFLRVLAEAILKLLHDPEAVSSDELAVLGFRRRSIPSGDSCALETNDSGQNIVRDKLTGKELQGLVTELFCCLQITNELTILLPNLESRRHC